MAVGVARTIRELPDDQDFRALTDRSQRSDGAVRRILGYWEADLGKRRPAAIYTMPEEGEPIYRGTDLDLFTVMLSLAQKGRVINIPEYRPLRAKTANPDEWIVSPRNRHGKVTSVTSHRNTHAFSVGIMDVNVIWGDAIGRPRNFMLTDDEGNLYKGWETFDFDPATQRWFEQKGLTAEGKINFPYFVMPALAMAVYGKRYLLTKTAAKRAADEAAFYGGVKRKLLEKGVRLPKPAGMGASPPKIIRGPSRAIRIKVLEAELSLPGFAGQYPYIGIDENGRVIYNDLSEPAEPKYQQAVLRYAARRYRNLTFAKGRGLRAASRATELAFRQSGFRGGEEIYPPWAVGRWDSTRFSPNPGTREPKNIWRYLPVTEGIALYYRIHQTTGRVRA